MARRIETPAGILDKMIQLRARIRARNAETEKLKREFKALEELAIIKIQDTGSDMSRGKYARGNVYYDMVGSIDDWNTFSAWVYKNKALYMLPRRLNIASLREWIDTHDGELPPGITTHELVKLSLVKYEPKD